MVSAINRLTAFQPVRDAKAQTAVPAERPQPQTDRRRDAFARDDVFQRTNFGMEHLYTRAVNITGSAPGSDTYRFRVQQESEAPFVRVRDAGTEMRQAAEAYKRMDGAREAGLNRDAPTPQPGDGGASSAAPEPSRQPRVDVKEKARLDLWL